MIPDTEWARDAACRDHPTPDLWFPTTDDGKAGGGALSGPAKRICRTCPVRVDCLDYALGHEQWGVWGGMSERERRTERTRRNHERAAERRAA